MEDSRYAEDGATLSLEQLRDLAARAMRGSGKTQTQVARELDVTDSAVSKAVNKAARNLAGLQRRLIAHLTSLRVREERSITYIVEHPSGD